MKPVAIALALAALIGNAAYAVQLPDFLARVHPTHGNQGGTGSSPQGTMDATFVALDLGLDYRREAWGDTPRYPAVIAGGLAAADVDLDGLIDLYFPPGGPEGSGATGARLYRNAGNWSFEDVTSAWGLEATGTGTGAAFADHDNDGDPDLAVLLDDGIRLYQNRGHAFTDASAHLNVLMPSCAGAPCQPSSAAWLDYDRDGDLDLFAVNNLDWRDPALTSSGSGYSSLISLGKPQRTILWANEGSSFRDATGDADAWENAKGLGVTTADLDGDGWTDVLTANDVTPNAALVNQRDGTFRNLARLWGLDESRLSSMGIQAADLDGDLRPDVVTSNLKQEGLSLHYNHADGFQDTRKRLNTVGLAASDHVTGWGLQLADFDLDGWLDVAHAAGRAVPLEPHVNDFGNLVYPDLREDTEDQLFRNVGGTFVQVKGSGFGDARVTRALVAVDLDRDGDLDVVRVNVDGQPVDVLRNDLRADHHSMVLDLAGSRTNRDGLGAVVDVTTPDGRTQRQEMAAATGYQSGVPAELTFGLGPHASASVVVRWPTGTVQDLGTLEAGRHVATEP